MYTKKEIIEEAKKLGKMMADTEQVEFFQKAEAVPSFRLFPDD